MNGRPDNSRSTGTLPLTLLLLATTAILLTPLAWMAFAAFTRPGESTPTADHFATLLSRHPFGRWLVNSLFVSATQTAVVVITSSLAGFALAKYRFPGRRVVMAMMLATLFLPFQVLLPSAYGLMLQLGWIDSFAAVIVPGSVSAFGTFLYMQASAAVPDELIAAARVDGCSELRIWWEVALPILQPMTGAYTLLAFVASWNSYLWPATVLLDESNYTLAVGLANLIGLPEYESQFGVLMAATMLGLLPLVLLFVWLRKEFVSGLAGGAVKG